MVEVSRPKVVTVGSERKTAIPSEKRPNPLMVRYLEANQTHRAPKPAAHMFPKKTSPKDLMRGV
jgi:hypothetical protein